MHSNFSTLSGKKIFQIGLGTGFTDFEYKNPTDLIKILNSAIELGVNFIDTAENYGDGLAEKLIGKTLKKNRSDIFISTKFSAENSSYQDIIRACHKSLKRLKTDYIDLYQFHWPNPKVDIKNSVKALQKLKKEGKIRFIGAGNFSVKQLTDLQTLLSPLKLSSHQIEFNIQEQFILDKGILNYSDKNQITTIAYSPLDQGRINPLNITQKKVITRLVKKYNKTFPQIILNWIIKNGQIIPIPKTSNLYHLIENINSLDFSLTKEDVLLLTNKFKPKVRYIKPSQIQVAKKGERGIGGYQTLREALENKLNLIPGPKELSEELRKDNSSFKPVRLLKDDNQFFLINDRVRYWAWVITYGFTKPIPVYIRENIPN